MGRNSTPRSRPSMLTERAGVIGTTVAARGRSGRNDYDGSCAARGYSVRLLFVWQRLLPIRMARMPCRHFVYSAIAVDRPTDTDLLNIDPRRRREARQPDVHRGLLLTVSHRCGTVGS